MLPTKAICNVGKKPKFGILWILLPIFCQLYEDISKLFIVRIFNSLMLKSIPTYNFESRPSISVGWKQQIVHILPSQKLPFFVQHKCCPFLWEDGNFSKIVLGSEKRVFEDCIVSNDTSTQCELRILDFFQNPHFFQKKWLINIYYACQRYNSLRKYHSREF